MNPRQKRARKNQLIREFGLRCWWCGCELPEEKLTLDHLMPRSRGGSHALENLRLAGFPCNNSRGNSLYPPPASRSCARVYRILVNQGAEHAQTFEIQ